MNKNVLIGIAAFGGLVLIALLLPNTPAEETQDIVAEENNETSLPSKVTNTFPTYPNTTTSESNETVGDEGKIYYSISLQTEDSIEEINEWYRQALSTNGWSIKSDKNIAGYQIIQGEKDNLYTSMQAATGEDNKFIISQQAQIRAQ